MTQFGQSFPATMTLVSAEPEQASAPHRPQTPTLPYPYRHREVTFTNARGVAPVTLAGTLTIPGILVEGQVPARAQSPAVIIVPDKPPRDRDLTIEGHAFALVLADHLTRHGFATLRLDDRGVGDSTGNKRTAAIDELVSDVVAAARFLGVQPEIDRNRIAIVGFGPDGATIALFAAADCDQVRATALLTPRLALLPRPPVERSCCKPALHLFGAKAPGAAFRDQTDQAAVEHEFARNGAAPLIQQELPDVNQWMQTVPDGLAPDDIGTIEETMSPLALEVLRAWLAHRLGVPHDQPTDNESDD